MMSWARVIESYEAVPEIYKNSYLALVENTGVLPYTVLAPALSDPRGIMSKEKLLCEINNVFYALEWVGSQVVTTGFRYQDICSLEQGNILIYSWFSISGNTNNGTDAVLTIKFNEATRRHLEPFFSKMRPAPGSPDQSDLKREQAKFDHLISENFKFMNFARGSLVSGEKVIQSIYQPQKRQNVFTVLGHGFYRIIFQAHLTVLTDKEVILIGDVEGMADKLKRKYGGVHCFIPLRSLTSVALEEQPNNLLRFTFIVSSGERVERLFDASHMQELINLKKALETLPG